MATYVVLLVVVLVVAVCILGLLYLALSRTERHDRRY
ncbi:putative membrane protein [Candidatus Protofrankia californiensis]|uniref:Putative membrane protein n=1 Tax=Candidatus Protofrankia californiensis TaxID=1839754 RepID=A0A1C3NYA0_9ACTN|nr:putative membrane protein [Candidatus Protofrankia californiensis]